jgi:hypothetical protein
MDRIKKSNILSILSTHVNNFLTTALTRSLTLAVLNCASADIHPKQKADAIQMRRPPSFRGSWA